MKTKLLTLILFLVFGSAIDLFAQDKEAKITLTFEKGDSLNVCKAHVSSGDSAVSEVSVKLFVQRLYSQLQIGRPATTNEEGVASFNFPNDIPAGQNGKLTVIAKIEDDENYKNAEAKADINWGVVKNSVDSKADERSLWASRERAPVYLIIVSNLIILAIWGTLIYVIFQIFRIKKISKIRKKNQ